MTLDLDHLRRVAEFSKSDAAGHPWLLCEAADPPTVLALIDRLEAAEAKLARVEALADDMFNDEQMHIEVALGGALFAGRAIRDALSGDLTASEDDGGPEGHRDDDNAGDGRCGAQEEER